MKYLILLTLSLSTFSFSIKDKAAGLSLTINLRKINDSRIIDPASETTTFNLNNKKYTFKTKDIFLKEYQYSKEIYAVDKQKHLHIKMRKVGSKSFHSIINLRIFKNNSHHTYNGVVEFKALPYVNQARIASE